MSDRRVHAPRVSAVRREGEQVTPLELFFDLVFVLALTQCAGLMGHHPHWEDIGKGLLVLGLVWWAWVGYAWLTSVVDPEEGGVRIAMFAAMAAFLVAALAVPGAFDDSKMTLAVALLCVRAGQITLFLIAARGEPALRHSVVGLAISTGIAGAIVLAGALLDGASQVVLWVVALVIDVGGPYLFGSEGWQLVPAHFAERHGLIVIIALGESIVAVGVGSEVGMTAGVVTAAVLSMALLATLWWVYFDVTSRVGAYRLSVAEVGREQNEMARDSYSYLHFPMVAGIVLVALGLEHAIGDVDHALETTTAVALTGGVALYLLAIVAFRRRNGGPVHWARVVAAVVVLATWPLVRELSALTSLAVVAAFMCGVIAFEAIRYAEARARVRHG